MSLSLSTFRDLLKVVDPNISDNHSLFFFKQALLKESTEKNQDCISLQTLIELVLLHGLGGYGVEFFDGYFRRN